MISLKNIEEQAEMFLASLDERNVSLQIWQAANGVIDALLSKCRELEEENNQIKAQERAESDECDYRNWMRQR